MEKNEIDYRKLPRFADHAFRITLLLPEWANAYGVPEEAIIRQLSLAHAWCAANPRRAPKKDVVRFLGNWMRLAQKHGNLSVRKAFTPSVPEPEGDMTVEEMIAIRQQNMKRYVPIG